MPLTPAKPPFLVTKSASDKAGQSFEQSESEAESVIIRDDPKSTERMVARKLPFSVCTVAVVRPDPGGP